MNILGIFLSRFVLMPLKCSDLFILVSLNRPIPLGDVSYELLYSIPCYNRTILMNFHSNITFIFKMTIYLLRYNCKSTNLFSQNMIIVIFETRYFDICMHFMQISILTWIPSCVGCNAISILPPFLCQLQWSFCHRLNAGGFILASSCFPCTTGNPTLFPQNLFSRIFSLSRKFALFFLSQIYPPSCSLCINL